MLLLFSFLLVDKSVSAPVPCVRFGILMVVLLKIQVVWDVTLFLVFHKDQVGCDTVPGVSQGSCGM